MSEKSFYAFIRDIDDRIRALYRTQGNTPAQIAAIDVAIKTLNERKTMLMREGEKAE